MKVETFQKAISLTDGKKRSILTANGFSIALFPNVFSYKSLLDSADFADKPLLAKCFEELKTSDFEVIIKALMETERILRVYFDTDRIDDRKMLLEHASALKSILIETIAKNHPESPNSLTDSQIESCRFFLQHFSHFFSVNYDIILYWVLIKKESNIEINFDDGFRNVAEDFESELDYVSWEEENTQRQNVYHLHGALYVFDDGDEVQKFTWNRTGKKLIQQVEEALDSGKFPLIVAEGSSREKKRKIQHSGVLSKGIRSLVNCPGSLFIYGHSLAENDDHIFRKIKRGKFSQVWISIYGDPLNQNNQKLIKRAQNLFGDNKKIFLGFFDASSAEVWTKKLPPFVPAT